MAEINKIKGIVVSQYGEAISLTVVDKNGQAIDISAYTTAITVYLRDPQTLKLVTCTASFITNGTDGKIQFIPAAGDIDRDGIWEGQIKMEKVAAIAPTQVFSVDVSKLLGAST